tara:strand:- start:10687 stop:12990 length:2304 start_codon:yes stop_codon:yes gene_type:complete
MILQVFLWIALVEFIGILFFPLCAFLFSSFKDKGFCISKVMGILIIGYVVWILGILKISSATQYSIIILVSILFFLWSVWFYYSKTTLLRLIRGNFSTFVISEIVFISAFFLFLFFRVYDPAILNTEQPMDFMFLNSIINADFPPPEDAWFKGLSVNYYYFGYWVFGTLGELAGIKSSVVYNLSLASIAGLSAISIFSIVFNLIHFRNHAFKYAIYSGIFSVILLLIVPNSKTFFDFIGLLFSGGLINSFFNPIDSINSLNPSWWWDTSRVIGFSEAGVLKDYTINEFPFFSFIVGDLHPHLMAMPFVLLCLSLMIELFKFFPEIVKFNNFSTFLKIFFTGLVLGCVGFINLWDYPVLIGLFFVLILVQIIIFRGKNFVYFIIGALITFFTVFSISFISILPFLSSIYGADFHIEVFIGPNSNWGQFLSVWLLFFLITLPFLVYFFIRSLNLKFSVNIFLLSMFLVSLIFSVWAYLFMENGKVSSELFGRFFQIIPVYIFIFLGVYSISMNLVSRFSEQIEILTVTLICFSLLLLIVPELIYLDDIFVTGFARMNTVFKLYFQSWIIFSIASGLVLGISLNLKFFAGVFTNHLVNFWGISTSVVLLILFYYTIVAPINKFQKPYVKTLDGVEYLKNQSFNEYEAINFVSKNITEIDGIVEAVGNDYSDYGRISSFTGVPTILGWPGHQAQWRNQTEEIYYREQDVFNIYKSNDMNYILGLLQKYSVSHVIVGPREIKKYQIDNPEKFGSYMDVVFENDEIKIYRIRE